VEGGTALGASRIPTVGASASTVCYIPAREALPLNLEKEKSLAAGAVREVEDRVPVKMAEGVSKSRRSRTGPTFPGVMFCLDETTRGTRHDRAQSPFAKQLHRAPERHSRTEVPVGGKMDLPTPRGLSCDSLGTGNGFDHSEILEGLCLRGAEEMASAGHKPERPCVFAGAALDQCVGVKLPHQKIRVVADDAFADEILRADPKKSRCIYLRWIPTTSNDVERLFSTAGRVLTPERQAMNPVRLETLLFLEYNKGLWDLHTVSAALSPRRSSRGEGPRLAQSGGYWGQCPHSPVTARQ
jgi:hypothetical protein